MDKRWIYILIIFIIGVGASYLVIESSTTVGSALVGINTFTITVPDSYNIENSNHDAVTVLDRNTNEKIFVLDVGKGNLIKKTYDEELGKIANNYTFNNITNSSEVYKNITFTTVKYNKLPNNLTCKISIFMKFNHTFLIKSTNYPNENLLNEKTHFVIDSLKQDYKKAQD